MSWSFEFELGVVAYEADGMTAEWDGAAPLNDDAVAVEDLRPRLRRKQVAASEVDFHLLPRRELELSSMAAAALAFADLSQLSLVKALVTATDLVVIARHKRRAALRANARLYHSAALLCARRRRFANRCWRFTAQSIHRLAAI